MIESYNLVDDLRDPLTVLKELRTQVAEKDAEIERLREEASYKYANAMRDERDTLRRELEEKNVEIERLKKQIDGWKQESTNARWYPTHFPRLKQRPTGD